MASWQSVQVLVNRKLLFAGIFLIALSGLVLEVSITRIFSAAIWYHFAFVAVSVALVGLGASGLVVQHRVTKLKGKWAENLTIYSAWGITIFIPITLFVMHALASQVIYLPLYMVLFSVPFFLMGIIISAAFNAFASVAGRLYAADLIGASVGALLVVLFLVLTGGEGSTLIVGLIAAVSSTLFARITRNTRKTIASVIFVGFAISLILLNHATQIFAIPTDPTAQKDLPIYLREYPGSKIVKTEWNSFSRIDVVEGGGGGSEGLVAKVFIDGGAGTNIISWDGNTGSRQELSTWMQYLPFKMMQDPKVLVIGSGGGRDVVASLVSGSKDVTSVEINPIIYETVKSYGDRAGNVYSHQNVRSYVDEGRSFITRSSEKYDIIYVPFVDTWASVSSGGLSVSENFLYTLEGFQQYYDHLSERGKIVTVRWLIDAPRFISTYAKLLEQNGIPQDQLHRHLIMVTSDSYTQDPSVTMVVFSKTPFTDEEISFLSQSFSQYDYKPILLPGQVMREPYTALLSGDITLNQFYNQFATKVYPVTDDNPYFLSFEKPLPPAVEILLYASIGIVAIFVLVPFVWIRRIKSVAAAGHQEEGQINTKRSQIGIATVIPYFAALGVGFMLIELALLQKLILLMGNPTMTFALLLFTILISSGGGSLLSSRIAKNNMRNLVFVIGGIAGLGMLYVLLVPSIIYSALAEPLEIKAAVSVGVLAPIGFLMGMPLPTGMRLLKVHRPDFIPWMWAINGAFSVLGAVLAIALGIMYGSSFAMILGVLVYLIALGISFVSKKKTITQVVT
jgi:hypothetical protein